MSEQSDTHATPVEFTGCRPVLPVKDVGASIAHYCDVLGFVKEWHWSDDDGGAFDKGAPIFAYVYRGHFQLFLARRSPPIQPVEIVVGVTTVDGVDRVYAEYQSSGATIVEPPAARPWGTYDMKVRDPDHHVLSILTNLPSDS